MPLPRWLLPRSRSAEGADGPAATFDVEICLPGIGRIVRYRGRIEAGDARPPDVRPVP